MEETSQTRTLRLCQKAATLPIIDLTGRSPEPGESLLKTSRLGAMQAVDPDEAFTRSLQAEFERENVQPYIEPFSTSSAIERDMYDDEAVA